MQQGLEDLQTEVVMRRNEERVYECSKILTSDSKPILVHLMKKGKYNREIAKFLARADEMKRGHIIEKLE